MRSTWLTAARVRRLLDILKVMPRRLPGIRVDEARLRFWRSCGGPIDDVNTLIDVLIGADLVIKERAALRLTRNGQTVLAKHKTEGLRPLGLTLLRAGYFYDQARLMLDTGSADADGNLSWPTRSTRQVCPQLVGIIQLWPDVVVTKDIQVPRYLALELSASWALLPPASPDDTVIESIRRNVGDRGELYSYQFERQRSVNRSDIVWVARDDSTIGYDLEDRSVSPHRRIEVKASGSTSVTFFLSGNEWRKAHDSDHHYEIHFWGGIDLNSDPAEEYTLLTSRGYPLVFVDLRALILAGDLIAEPTKWRLFKT